MFAFPSVKCNHSFFFFDACFGELSYIKLCRMRRQSASLLFLVVFLNYSHFVDINTFLCLLTYYLLNISEK